MGTRVNPVPVREGRTVINTRAFELPASQADAGAILAILRANVLPHVDECDAFALRYCRDAQMTPPTTAVSIVGQGQGQNVTVTLEWTDMDVAADCAACEARLIELDAERDAERAARTEADATHGA